MRHLDDIGTSIAGMTGMNIILSKTDSPVATPTAPARVLVVEDSAAERARLSAMLRRLGLEPREVADGRAALQLLRTWPADIVLSDWVMPEMDGLDLCRAVTRDERFGRPYFVMLTGRRNEQDLADGLEAGADDFIGKPAAASELKARIRAGLRTIQLRKRLQARNLELDAALERERASFAVLQDDLSAAAQLQRRFLPNLAELPPGLEADLLYQPAATIGGDALGLHPLDDGRVALFVADVCGHGIAAAMHSIGLARRLSPEPRDESLLFCPGTQEARSPEQVLAQVNAIQCIDRPSGEVTSLAYGVLDLHSGEGRLSLAGHPKALCLRADGSSEWLGEYGLPAGVIDSAKHDATSFHLATGDCLMLYSDGLMERGTRGRDADQAAMELRALLDSLPARGPSAVIAAIQDWLGPGVPADDTSVLVVARTADA